MATWNSNTYDGRYLQLYISETINTVNNTSTLNWTLSSIGGNVNYYTVDETTVTINGTQVYYKARTPWDAKVFPAAKGSVSGSITVAHNSGGDKTINVSFKTRVYIYGSTEYGGNMTLTKIDRSAPTVSISTSGITAYGVTVSATASTTCDIWDYSINGGSSWVNFSNSATTSASKAITGLSPNTSYTIKVRARKKSNQVYGTSGGSSVKTLGNAVLNSVSTLTADAATVTLSFNWTVYSTGFTYTLDIKKGSTVITTITIPAQSSTGKVNKTITLTSAQKTAILSAMSSVKTFTGTFSLTTKSGSTTIGSVSSKTATVQTTATNSAPTFSNSAGFTYKDSKSSTVAITGNNQIMIQGYSTLAVTAYEANAKNGASITQYQATINEAVISSSGTTLNCGTISKSGNLILKVTAVDSRGYSVSVSKTITVAAYTKVDITNVVMRRVNEVEAVTQVELSATLSKILVSNVNKNAFRYLYYRYKKTSDTSYNSYTTIPSSSITITDTSVKFKSDEFISLDPDYSYHVQFYLLDKLTSEVYTVTLPAGTPLISKRRKKVGINNRNPKAALDVVGGFILDGVSVDYIVQQGTSGIWTYRKWNSGIAECWGRKAVNTIVATAWGNVYASGALEALNMAYPFTFKELPTLTTNLTCNGYGAILMVPGATPHASTTSTGVFEICRGSPAANNVTYIVNYHAIGKWK